MSSARDLLGALILRYFFRETVREGERERDKHIRHALSLALSSCPEYPPEKD